jgi:hypothetical protein
VIIMKEDFEQDDQAQDGSSDQDGAVEEVLDAEGAGDSAFVVAEEKQPLSKGTVAMFVILALAGAGTYFMYLRTGPQTATAAVDPKAQQVIKQYMADPQKSLAGTKKMLKDTEAIVQQLKNAAPKLVPLADLAGNPFRVTPVEPGNTSLANLAVDAEREKKRREEERAAVSQAVGNLQLQSVMSGGARSSCMINNALYTEGQQVEQFTIEKVSPNSVIVRHGNYRFELRMQR